jgi:hypothetical protein
MSQMLSIPRHCPSDKSTTRSSRIHGHESLNLAGVVATHGGLTVTVPFMFCGWRWHW